MLELDSLFAFFLHLIFLFHVGPCIYAAGFSPPKVQPFAFICLLFIIAKIATKKTGVHQTQENKMMSSTKEQK